MISRQEYEAAKEATLKMFREAAISITPEETERIERELL